MTEVVEYFCKSCGKRFGTIGMHGFDPRAGNGERPVTCSGCKAIQVARYEHGKMVAPECPTCRTSRKLMDGKCPACGSAKLYFRDVHFPPDVAMNAVDLTAEK